MAEAVVSFVVERLGDLLSQKSRFLWKVSDHVQQMQTELRRMQCFLEDADARQEEDQKVRNWVAEIREVAYDAEDVVESFILKVESRRSGVIQKIFTKLDWKVGSEIKDIQIKISDLTRSLETYGIVGVRRGDQNLSSAYGRRLQLRRTYSHMVEEDLVGLEERLSDLADRLVGDDKCQVVSICGMGGLGKTTLARKVYHQGQVRSHFDGFAWAYISQQCQPKDVLQGILINLTSATSTEKIEISHMREEELVKKLYQVQEEKKCLVILDDIWTTQAWDNLRPAFPIGQAASKILLTTRNKDVAIHADPQGFLHEPWYLTEEQSWQLLQRKAMLSRRDPTDPAWKILGMEMVRRCGGLPLALVVLGGLLATKHTLKEWEMVHRNIGSYIRRGKGHEEEHEGISEVLALSYYDLPYQLKPCFLYLGHFPEDFDIPTKKLMRMWAAEGIVCPVEGERVEDVAERYLGELIDRCMIQAGKRSLSGNLTTCRLHDLMRDLCLSKAKEENFLEVIHLQDGNKTAIGDFSSSMVSLVRQTVKVRRLAIYLDQGVNIFIPSKHEKSLPIRSLLYFHELGIRNWEKLKLAFQNFKLLRVLDFEGFEITEGQFPTTIGHLIHLRYLNLSNSRIRVLPSSIGNLRCLNTLDLSQDFSYILKIRRGGEIPNALWKMEQLRHLYLPWRYKIIHAEKLRLDTLTNLEILRYIDPNKCCVKDLVKLKNLRKLHIHAIKSIDQLEVIFQPPSPVLMSIRSLSLHFFDGRIEEGDLRQLLSGCHHDLYRLYLAAGITRLPEHNAFPRGLTKLFLWGSKLEEDPMVTLEKLPHLKFLSLSETFIGMEMVCSETGFPQLKYLSLSLFPSVEEWKVDEGTMPSLCNLRIIKCQQLKKVPDGLRFIVTLQKMEVSGMPEIFLDRLREGGEDFHKVQHVPSIQFMELES